MDPRSSSLWPSIAALILIASAAVLILYPELSGKNQLAANNSSEATTTRLVAAALSATTPAATSTPTHATTTAPIKAMLKKAPKIKEKAPSSVSAPTSSKIVEITRIAHPYSTPALSSDTVNTAARASLVNILCMPRSGTLHPISGSGVIIDSRGVILTNAHVAQYVLLSEAPEINLSCIVRTGSPATPAWTAEVLYIPPVWVNAHAADINSAHPQGTGEHDYALLRITGLADGSPLPSNTTFPALSIDTREAIGFLGDQILSAGYPAEFVGGGLVGNDLYPVSSVSTVGQLLTFTTTTIDLISVGSVIEAQGGSSGGPVVNAWGRLVGIIATTSEGATTADRDLRAITLSYINRDLQIQSGFDLPTFLEGDLAAEEKDFNANLAPPMIKQYIQQILPQQ